MAKDKDFKGIAAGKVKSTIAEATQEAPTAQEELTARKDRRTYSEQEIQEFSNSLQTAGRKGMKLPRVNLAFAPDIYEYVKIMSKAGGMTYTEFINKILQAHKAEHEDIYQQAIKIRNSL